MNSVPPDAEPWIASTRGHPAVRAAARAAAVLLLGDLLDRIARARVLLEPLGDGPDGPAETVGRIAALVAGLDDIAGALVDGNVADGGFAPRLRAETVLGLLRVEAGLRGEWASHLGNGPAADLARLTEAYRLIHRASVLLHPGTVC
jgi:hypothetical protein